MSVVDDEIRLVVRPAEHRDLARRVTARFFPGEDYDFETASGASYGRLKLHLARTNEFAYPTGDVITLTREGVLVPRFEARRGADWIAAIEYEYVRGAMTLSFPDGARHRLEQSGLLLPVTRLVEPGGRVALEVEAWRLSGREYQITLRPSERWAEPTLLAIAALVFHARQSLSILYSAALGAGVLAPAEPALGHRRAFGR